MNALWAAIYSGVAGGERDRQIERLTALLHPMIGFLIMIVSESTLINIRLLVLKYL